LAILERMKSMGFQSTGKYFRDKLIEKLPATFKKALKSINFEKNTFNHDTKFQMKYLGDQLKRTLNSSNDPRVKFKPDDWQRKLLDIVDNHESAIICAPTSSGKTFISYYAMEQSLRQNHNDMVVFVAPNKALANQIVAEIYTRFGSKQYPQNNQKFLYAMLMPDYEINVPSNCQILVTVPHSFENVLSKKFEWTKNIKYIILDEVQTLNDRDLSLSMEKIIHFASCPILALSATIGNLNRFYGWMSAILESKQMKLHKIVHSERFCDLKKYIYVPKELNEDETNDSSSIIPVHELFGYSLSHLNDRKFNVDFHLLPSEIVEMLYALKLIAKTYEQKSLVESIKPNKFFTNVLLTKNDVKNYEKFLIEKLRGWCQNGDVFTSDDFCHFFEEINGKCEKVYDQIEETYGPQFSSKEWSLKHIFDLVVTLFQRKMLPALVFLRSSEMCTNLAARLTQHLENLESSNRKTNKKDDEIRKKLEKKLDQLKDQLKKNKSKQNDDLRELHAEIEELESKMNVLGDDKIDLDYTFLDFKYKISDQELNEEIRLHRHRSNIPKVKKLHLYRKIKIIRSFLFLINFLSNIK
jgi:hypothetical protein